MAEEEATKTSIMLTVGRHVKIHSLASEKARKHNGKTAIVKAPIDEASGRCGVQPVGDAGSKILSIKPINVTILCSLCKMREEKTDPGRVMCERCRATSYCSRSCKDRHWEGANKECGVPNCHKGWCIPLKLEMEPPTQAVGDSNVGEEAFEYTQRYLQLAANIGNSGRRNEERVMLERLMKVDERQPCAYHNLFHSCRELAAMAERYFPDKYPELEKKAIDYLTLCVCMVQMHAVPGGNLDGQTDLLVKALIRTINEQGLSFVDGCMQGRRGADNPLLINIHDLLRAIIILFKQRGESPHLVHYTRGFCCMKLMKYTEAVEQFELCRDASQGLEDGKHLYHVSLMQIPLCMSSVAMYSNDEGPRERADTMKQAVANFDKAIDVLKAEDPSMVYSCQAKCARTVFNQNSLLTQLAAQGGIEYTQKEKDGLRSTMSNMAAAALQGAVAAGDASEIQAIESLRELPLQ